MNVNRRQTLKTIGALAAGTTIIPGQVAASGDPLDLIAVGANELDINGDGKTDVNVYIDSLFSHRSTLITSDGKETTDYATSIIAVGNIRFGDINYPDGLTYQWNIDEDGVNDDTGTVPDEFWMLVEDSNGTQRVLFDTLNEASAGGPGVWNTAHPMEKHHVEHPTWKQLHPTWGKYTVDDDDVLKRMGVGRGRTGDGVISEVYYDDPRVNGRNMGEFPATSGRRGKGSGSSSRE